MLEVEQARAQILARVRAPGRVRTTRVERAHLRVVADAVSSPSPLPRNRLATMDGFALRRAERDAELDVAGLAAAGAPYGAPVEPGSCVRIATGAVVPENLDLVVPVELSTVRSGRVTFAESSAANIRQVGAELGLGDPVIAAGSLLTAPTLGLLYSLGVARVRVHDRPVVGVLSTGDELRLVGEQLGPGLIYDANRILLLAELERLGLIPKDLGLVRDSQAATVAALARAERECDAIISIGGASVGERDYVKQALAERGELISWRVAIKPGKPLIFGQIGNCYFFGLPGNPASAFVCLHVIVAPALRKLGGRDPEPLWPLTTASTEHRLAKTPGRADYQRGLLKENSAGSYSVRSTRDQGSASLPALAEANCLIALPRDAGDVEPGEPVSVLTLDSRPR